MSVRTRSAAEVLYQERQRIPWLGALYVAAVSAALGASGSAIGAATGGRSLYPFGVIVTGAMGAFGGLLALVSPRKIRLEPELLRVGRKVIPLAAVAESGILRGRELRRVRSRIVRPASRASPLLLGGVIPILGLGVASIGGYMWATREIRIGNCCSPGQGPAVYLHTPTLGTPLWIVGTQDPERLLAAIGVERFKQPASVEEGGWLPPPREH